MDHTDRAESHENVDQIEQIADPEEGAVENPAAGALIAANLAGVNTGISSVTSGAPSSGNLGGVSADQAGAVIEGDDDTDVGPLNLDALEGFGDRGPGTRD